MAKITKQNHGETVLVAQDSATLRSKTARMLEADGYRVYLATSGNEALEIWKVVDSEIDLLIVDVKMSPMSGQELAQVMRALRPNLKVLYMSGKLKSMAKSNRTSQRRHFLKKPFQTESLLQAVRSALDARG